MRNACANVIYELIKKDSRVMALAADGGSNIFMKIKENYPKQYVDYGIAESNMVGSAAGLASCGKIPFIHAATNFIAERAFEFIRDDVCFDNRNVKIIGMWSGLERCKWGFSHQGTEDLAILRTLPNMLVISPATPIEACEATKYAYEHKGPVYIRLEGLNEAELYNESYRFSPGKGYVVREGEDVAIISMGSVINEAISAASFLERQGISTKIVNMPTVKPIDKEIICNTASKVKAIITLEEHSIYGGLGSAVAEVLAENNISIKFTRMGLNGCAVGCGNRKEIREINGLDDNSIYKRIIDLL